MRALEDAAILNELDLEKRYYISLIDTDWTKKDSPPHIVAIY